MAAIAKPLTQHDATVLPIGRLHRLSVPQYHRMIRAGVLGEHERVMLLEGWLVEKMSHNPPHDVAITLAQAELLPLLPGEWLLRIQSAITTSDSEPEPDIAVVRGPARRYTKSHPRPRDIGMLIEAAETSLAEDRIVQARVYARSRIPVYWIINLIDRQIEVYTRPSAGRLPSYEKCVIYRPGDQVPAVIGRRVVGSIAVVDLLP